MTIRSSLLAAAASLALALPAAAATSGGSDVSRAPTDLPPPLTRTEPAHVTVNLDTVEVVGTLADGTTYEYWTYNAKVPGPFVRVRAGDTVTVNLTNADGSMMAHNVDFHAVTGPHGGGSATTAMPGETKSFTFKALQPGLYVYHCAVPVASHHIAKGMYGMILVEPEEGMSKVDREFYVMQGELYTAEKFGTKGELTDDIDKLLDEKPEYYVFNGTPGALKADGAMTAKTDDTVRVFFGVGGPNKTSSFHVIGEIFDRAWPLAGLTSAPMTDVQTLTVPPGGATVVEFKTEVPGPYVLVDHALSRVERGLAGILTVEGPERPDIFQSHDPEKVASGH
ncbi:copper-containing nitrite reductase [Novispirillum sp. DQ9]|uniref:copper-containing nitrite reductase n=1 Tax=Novispirillum sp. DQ9 TaxID=3398612 RepID=UPI003C7DE1E6